MSNRPPHCLSQTADFDRLVRRLRPAPESMTEEFLRLEREQGRGEAQRSINRRGARLRREREIVDRRLRDVEAYAEAMRRVIDRFARLEIHAAIGPSALSVPRLRREVYRAGQTMLRARLAMGTSTPDPGSWESAVWFDLRAVPYGSDDSMEQMGRDLVRRGVLSLPFPEVVFVVQVVTEDGETAFLAQRLGLDATGVIELRGQVIVCGPDAVYMDAGQLDGEVYYYLAVMATPYVERRSVPLPLSRASAGGRPPLPQEQYMLVTLDQQYAECQHRGGRHASPRLHWRRGHVRVRAGRASWVQAHLVGSRERGVILHDYRFDGEGDEL